MDNLKIGITEPSLVAAAALAVSTDPCRFYLHGVCIQLAPQGGLHIIATNGHILSVGYDKYGHMTGLDDREEIILKLTSQEFALFAKHQAVEITQDIVSLYKDEKSTMGDDLILSKRLFCDYIDGTFPDWRRVVPKPLDEQRHAPFNAKYLATFARMQKCFPDHGDAIVITGNSSKNPYVVRFPSVENWFGIVMPMLASMVGIPEWYLEETK